MKLNDKAELYIWDGTPEKEALARTTCLGISAHQDDIELMSWAGILGCFGKKDKWFSAIVTADGAGSPRTGLYADYTNEEMMEVRRLEQKKAAFVGEYAALALLNYTSSAIKDGSNRDVIEDYKEIETEYALLGFSDGNQVIIPAILEFLIVSKQHKGIALKGKVVPTGSFEYLVEQFKRFVLEMGFVGVFDIDFYKSGGQFYFCEMNLRFGGSGYAVTKMGVNLPAIMIESFYGESIERFSKMISKTTIYVNEKMCMDDWNGGQISRKEFETLISDSEIRFIPDEKDINPQVQYKKQVLRCYLINWIKRITK